MNSNMIPNWVICWEIPPIMEIESGAFRTAPRALRPGTMFVCDFRLLNNRTNKLNHKKYKKIYKKTLIEEAVKINEKQSIDQTIKRIKSFKVDCSLTWRRLFSKLSRFNSPVSTLAIVTGVGNRIAQTEMTKATFMLTGRTQKVANWRGERRHTTSWPTTEAEWPWLTQQLFAISLAIAAPNW